MAIPEQCHIEKNGCSALVGLSALEPFEFETLDELLPLGADAWRDGLSTTHRENSWLGLFQEHEAAMEGTVRKNRRQSRFADPKARQDCVWLLGAK